MTEKIILVTGMSGAGKTTALKTFEDMGFTVVDNIPLAILSALIESSKKIDNLVIGVDIRTSDFDAAVINKKVLPLLISKNFKSDILFLDSDDDVLIKRFSETRRKHPLSKDRPVIAGLKKERKLLFSLRDSATHVLDTTKFSPRELKNWIKENYSSETSSKLNVSINSFSFKRGLPREADLVFDVRFLKNPFYIASLTKLNGLDKKVSAYIEKDENFRGFYERILSLLTSVIPLYQNEGKNYLTIAIGCTGGKHRSVFVANKLFEDLKSKKYNLRLSHREIKTKKENK